MIHSRQWELSLALEHKIRFAMKTVFTRMMLLLTFIGVASIAKSAVHVISQNGSTFEPALVNCAVGDIIRWEWSSGSHNTISATVPEGASSWNAPLNSANPSFEYTVLIPGSYGYYCSFHVQSQMVGAFIASGTVGVKPVLTSNPELIVGVEIGTRIIHVRLSDASPAAMAIRVYDLTGRKVATIFDGQLADNSQDWTLDANGWERGIYFVRLESGTKVITRKIMIE